MWAGNDFLVATVSSTERVDWLSGPRREWYLMIGLDLTKGKAWRPMLTGIPDVMNVAAGRAVAAMRDGQPLVVVPVYSFKSNMGVLSLVEIKPGRAGGTLTSIGTPDTVDIIIGPDGRPAAREDYGQRTGEWRLML